MIRDKRMLLAGMIIIMIQVVWTPGLWSIEESGGHHWWLIRLPLLLSLPLGVGLFLASIENRGATEQVALSAMDDGQFELAAGRLQDAIRIHPQDSSLYSSQALALMLAGRDTEAKASIQKSLEIDPDNQLNQCIAEIIEDVATGKRSRPASMSEV